MNDDAILKITAKGVAAAILLENSSDFAYVTRCADEIDAAYRRESAAALDEVARLRADLAAAKEREGDARKLAEAVRLVRSKVQCVEAYLIAGDPLNAQTMVAKAYEKLAALDAALALPDEPGDVVERAAIIAREAFNRFLWTGSADFTRMEGWRHTMRALHAAGLLAGAWDRERLAHRLATWRFTNGAPGGEPIYPPAPIDYEEADAILREMGR